MGCSTGGTKGQSTHKVARKDTADPTAPIQSEPVSFIFVVRTNEKMQSCLVVQPLGLFGTEPFKVELGYGIAIGTAAAVVGSSIFLTGGKQLEISKEAKAINLSFVGGSTSSAVFLYHSDMLHERYFHATAAAGAGVKSGAVVLALSGISIREGKEELVASCEKYSTALDYWEEIAPIPRKREELAACALDAEGLVAAFGGVGEDGLGVGWVDLYDVGRNKWDSVEVKESGWRGRRNMGAVCMTEGEILLFGGPDSDGKDTFRYSHSSKTVRRVEVKDGSIKSQLHVEGMNPVVNYKGRIYCVAGGDRVFVYTMKAQRWEETFVSAE